MIENSIFTRSVIGSPVGDGQVSVPEDVVNTRRNLQRLNFYGGEINLPFIDGSLDRSIRAFQKQNNLKVEGFMRPSGETEQKINNLLRFSSGDTGVPSVKSEPLEAPPPPERKMIPGTDFPDESIAEGEIPYNNDLFKFRKQTEPKEPFEIKPPSIGSRMIIRNNELDLTPIEWDI